MLDDFVMLGTTVPEPCHDGRVFVCSAGWSADAKGLRRIYPLARKNIPRRWNVYQVPVEVNPHDARLESYKVRGDRTPGAHESINDAFALVARLKEKDRAKALRPYVLPSIAECNRRRLSLAIIQPPIAEPPKLVFEHNPASPFAPQLRLFDDGWSPVTSGAKRFPYLPRLRFVDEEGPHDLQLRDWGCFELMRKHQDTPAYFQAHMAAALHLSGASSLLVGNMSHQRTTWLVIAVLNGLRATTQLPLEDAA